MPAYNTLHGSWVLNSMMLQGVCDTSFKKRIKLQPLPFKTLAVFVMRLTT